MHKIYDFKNIKRQMASYQMDTFCRDRPSGSVGNTEGNTEKIPIPKNTEKILPVFFGFLKI
jgi:hypothetical protein